MCSLTPFWTTTLILMGARPASSAARMPSSTLPGPEPSAIHLSEDIVVQGVQAYRDPFQARIPEMLGLLGQQKTVGGQG